MKPYVALLIPDEDLELFKKIEIIIQEMPDIDFGEQGYKNGKKVFVLSCHMVARALARFFPVKYHDGYCGGCEHSWLTTKTGNIIDVYPVGTMGGPMLFPTAYFTHPFVPLYKEKALSVVKDIHFKRDVNKVAENISQTMEKLGIKPDKKSAVRH